MTTTTMMTIRFLKFECVLWVRVDLQLLQLGAIRMFWMTPTTTVAWW